METREYFEKVMQDYNQNRNGRSLRKYCKDEAVDYNWLLDFKKTSGRLPVCSFRVQMGIVLRSRVITCLQCQSCFANCLSHD